MMITEVKESLTKVIILDISGVYTQIHNQGFYPDSEVWKIKKMYSDRDRWRVIILGE